MCINKFMATQISSRLIGDKKDTIQTVAAFHDQKPDGQCLSNSHRQPDPFCQQCRACPCCGHNGHNSADCGILHKGLSCLSCGKKGHLASVCHSHPMNAFLHEEGPPDAGINFDDDGQQLIHPEVTPQLKTYIYHKCRWFPFRMFPDSGGSLTLVATDLVHRKHILMEDPAFYHFPWFTTINRNKLCINGIVDIYVKIKHNGLMHCIKAIVSPDVSNEIILGFPQLHALKILPKNFLISCFSPDVMPSFLEIKNCSESEKWCTYEWPSHVYLIDG